MTRLHKKSSGAGFAFSGELPSIAGCDSQKGGAKNGAVFFFFSHSERSMNKQTLKSAAFVLAVVAAAAFVQRQFMTIPVVGEYLPK